MLGLVLQRAMLICFATLVPIFALWAHIDPVLVALHIDPEVAAGAARYLTLMSGTLLVYTLSNCLNR